MINKSISKPNLCAIIMTTKACNLACDYCYVAKKDQGIMSYPIVDLILDQFIQYNDPKRATRIIWHGGEPMLAGIDFYRHTCSLIRERYPDHDVRQSIQTNGTLLNDEWIDFFKDENIAVGISLDGSKELHDSCRKWQDGHGSFDQVFKNIINARDRGLLIGTLSVITRHTVGHEDEIFDFFYKNKLDFAFHPITPLNDWMKDELSITAEEFGRISTRLFDIGFFQPEPIVTTVGPTLHYATAIMTGRSSGFCVFSDSCAKEYISFEPDGQAHVCNRFTGDSGLSFGNIVDIGLEGILDSPVRKEFLRNRASLLRECQKCKWVTFCQAGCPHEAYAKTGSIFERDPFCSAHRTIFQHVYDRLSQELEKANKKLPASQLNKEYRR